MPSPSVRVAIGWTGCLLMIAGCGTRPSVPPGTGAQAAASAYFEALVRKDWAGAYSVLHPGSRAACSLAQFTRKAESYRRRLGFDPQQVAVRLCEEHATEALAHVLIKGQAGTRARSYKDAVVLRRAESGWGVALPPQLANARQLVGKRELSQ